VDGVDRDFFITSDMPVIFLPNNQGKAGPGASGSNAIFPLSPRRLLVMFDLDEALRQDYVEVDPSAERLRVFNRELLNRSLRFAFSSNEQPEPTAIPASAIFDGAGTESGT
jgi:hypothetical protein